MNDINVAIFRFEKNAETVKRAVQSVNAFKHLPSNAKVVIKPNIVVWLDSPYPKWGVVTTSTIMEETVILLKEYGVTDISIVEGSLQMVPGEKQIGQKSFEGLGYTKLRDRYGVKLLDVWERPFEKVALEDGLSLNVNTDLMASDFLVNLPVLKTHAQVKVSLGIKNLKGFLNVSSRKKCHNSDVNKDLDYMVSKLPGLLPPSATIIDGIYTLERGPSIDGKPKKSNLVIASSNVLCADMVGARVLGHDPKDIPYLAQVASDMGISTDFSQINVKGEKIDDVASFHNYTFPFNEDNTLPLNMEKMGIKGIKFHKYDTTVCTYCSPLIGMLLTIIAMSYKAPFDDVEFLTGKRLRPSKGSKKSILVGQCMCALNKNHEGPQEIVKIKGCPPDPKSTAIALKGIGIDVDPSFFTNFDMVGAFMMERFKSKPEFDESYYTIQ
ncbi:DUF362 domain-containing protein [Desulfobacula sp.]|uniref:DUF362 domain-containing protein n=1 Tax=Desulfobacula sp. TaxID=2593537 RepID=UPI002611E8EA|nr:DUF362 domain-containing protein [Desulfobacula sp.]